MLRIQLEVEAMRHIKLNPIGQTTRWLNKPFGLDGIYVASTDLDISFSELRMLFLNYLSDYNSTAIDDTK